MDKELGVLVEKLHELIDGKYSRRVIIEAFTLYLVIMFDKTVKPKQLRSLRFITFEMGKMKGRIHQGLKASGWSE